MTATHADGAECIYCGATDIQHDEAPTDDEGWAAVAAEHAPHCEWVLTRAHTRDLPVEE